jgi:hypothetical protein
MSWRHDDVLVPRHVIPYADRMDQMHHVTSSAFR